MILIFGKLDVSILFIESIYLKPLIFKAFRKLEIYSAAKINEKSLYFCYNFGTV